MPAPTPYTRSYDFEAYQLSNPNDPLPADEVSQELDAVAVNLDEIIDRLALLQRDDGGLKNQTQDWTLTGTLTVSALVVTGAAFNAAAVNVSFDPTGTDFSATDLQAALEEVDSFLAALPTFGTAAAADTTDFATAAQGATADTATQPGDLAAVATSGDYDDLTNKPTLGTAAAAATGDFATAAQGSTADTALQPGAIGVSVQAYDADNAPVLGLQSFNLHASYFKPAASNGAEAGDNDHAFTIDYDPSTEETASAHVMMPESYDGGAIYVRVQASHPSTTTNFGFVLGFSFAAIGDGDNPATAAGSEVTVTDTGGTTDRPYLSPLSAAITGSNTPAGGKPIRLDMKRKVANGSDTMAVDLQVWNVQVFYTVDAGTDD